VSRLVQCFSSHPNVMKIEPEDVFMLSGVDLLCGCHRGTLVSRLVQCFSSHPNIMKIEPEDVFMLSGVDLLCGCHRGTQVSRLVQCFSSHPNVMKIEPEDVFMLSGVDLLCGCHRGTQVSRLVQCFSSHPSVMKIEPEDAFMLPANSLQELCVGVRPMSANSCSQLLYINVVDVEMHQVHFTLRDISCLSRVELFIYLFLFILFSNVLAYSYYCNYRYKSTSFHVLKTN